MTMELKGGVALQVGRKGSWREVKLIVRVLIGHVDIWDLSRMEAGEGV